MERAASRCVEWIGSAGYEQSSFVIFCGKGNNGGDGLAMARMLHGSGKDVSVYVLEFNQKPSEDFAINLDRLSATEVTIKVIQPGTPLPDIPADAVIIDALFGSGLTRPAEPPALLVIEHINSSGNEVISIDIPSGMFPDTSSPGGVIVKASHTLSFQCYKLAFLLPENAAFFGIIHILDIGLSQEYLSTIEPAAIIPGVDEVCGIYKPRDRFSHKGSFGHVLLIAGSFGKMGAAVLSARACLRAGAGLVTCFIPGCGYHIMQVSVPEAMAIADTEQLLISSINVDLAKYNAIAIGPGLGTDQATSNALDHFSPNIPIVADADALNMISINNDLFQKVTPFSIITPHPKEFERLFGRCENDFEKIVLAKKKAKDLRLVIILKGHHTFIAMPSGKSYFNLTGNPGMATAGSGDVLTGIISALLAQGYNTEQAAVLGVYLHGLAGDIAAARKSEESLIASDIIDCLGEAFLQVSGSRPSR